MTTENENVSVDVDLSDETAVPESTPAPEAPAPAPAPVNDGVEARFAALTAKLEEAQKQISQHQQLVLQQAMQATRQPDAPVDLLAKMRAADPEMTAVLEQYVNSRLEVVQQEVKRTQALSVKDKLIAQAQERGDEVAALAAAAYEGEVAAGRPINPKVILSWAVGEAVLSGAQVAPPKTAQSAPPPAAPKFAPQSPVVRGGAPTPKTKADLNKLTGRAYVQAVEAAGLDDFDLFGS